MPPRAGEHELQEMSRCSCCAVHFGDTPSSQEAAVPAPCCTPSPTLAGPAPPCAVPPGDVCEHLPVSVPPVSGDGRAMGGENELRGDGGGASNQGGCGGDDEDGGSSKMGRSRSGRVGFGAGLSGDVTQYTVQPQEKRSPEHSRRQGQPPEMPPPGAVADVPAGSTDTVYSGNSHLSRLSQPGAQVPAGAGDLSCGGACRVPSLSGSHQKRKDMCAQPRRVVAYGGEVDFNGESEGAGGGEEEVEGADEGRGEGEGEGHDEDGMCTPVGGPLKLPPAGSTGHVVRAISRLRLGARTRRRSRGAKDGPWRRLLSHGGSDSSASYMAVRRLEGAQSLNLSNFERSRLSMRLVVAETALVWLSFAGLQLLKGSRKGGSMVGVEPCSGTFWALTVLQAPLALLFTLAMGYHLYRAQLLRDSMHLSGIAGDIPWWPKQLIIYPLVSLGAGVLAGMVGIGGGMIMGPVLLQCGVLPEVTAATSAFMVFFSSTMATLQFALLGGLPYDYAFVFGGACLAASYAGVSFVRMLVKKYRKASLVVFCMGVLILIAALLTSTFGTRQLIRDMKEGKGLSPSRVC
eukprot:jgi/Mesvir1/12602/Mv17928-RA.3